MRLPYRKRETESANFDLSISDLMAALVLIFILLLATQFLEIKKQSNLASEYRENQQALITALKEEFKDDLAVWNADIDEKTLVIRFLEIGDRNTSVGFDPYSAELKAKFKSILDEFFPRYIAVLMRPEFKDTIEEVRIEGHTVNKNEDNTPEEPQEYALSVNLSQQRANTVLFYVLRGYDKSTESIEWVQKHITASGHAYSKPILANDGKPDRAKSRRVEFKIRTNNEDLIDAMISISGEKPE